MVIITTQISVIIERRSRMRRDGRVVASVFRQMRVAGKPVERQTGGLRRVCLKFVTVVAAAAPPPPRFD